VWSVCLASVGEVELIPLFLFFPPALFVAFDENSDNQIDFKEMACGISACCRGPSTERQKCELVCSRLPFF